jgi:hypothetical protein
MDKDKLRTISLTDDGSQWYKSYIVKNCTGELWQHLETSRIYTKPLQISDRNGDILHYQKAYSWPSHPQLLPGFESVGLACTVINFEGPAWPGLWATVLTACRPGPLGTLRNGEHYGYRHF